MIVARDVQLAELTGSRLHVCHVSTAESVDVIRWAKARGIQVTAEVTPHHLLLDTPLVAGYDTTFKVNPPLRTSEHLEAVREALADGTIDIVGTDHAPHARQDKDHPFDVALPGMLGLEQALAVVIDVMVNTGRMDWPTLVERMSTAPARIGHVAGQGRPLARRRAGQPRARRPVRPRRGRRRRVRVPRHATTPTTAATCPIRSSRPSGAAPRPTAAEPRAPFVHESIHGLGRYAALGPRDGRLCSKDREEGCR